MRNNAKINIVKSANNREIVTKCVFDAPRKLVFEALANPKLIPEWWGPKGFTMVEEKTDFMAGNTWRFAQRGPDGKEHAFNGVYQEVIPPAWLMIYIFEYENASSDRLLETVALEEMNSGQTELTDRIIFQKAADLKIRLKTGMVEWIKESMNRLAELLDKKGRPMGTTTAI